MNPTSKFLTILGLAAVSGFIAFAIVYGLSGDRPAGRAASGQEVPGEDVTPEPGSTPDFTKPLWYVPYQNAENLAPKFEGERNGIQITLNPDPRSDLACDGTFQIAPPERTLELAVSSEIGVPIRSLPAGVIPSAPFVYLCEGDAFHIIWQFNVEAGVQGVGAGGTGLDIYRLKGTNEFYREASERRWSDVEIDGIMGLLLEPIVVGPGAPIDGCMVAFRDDARELLTVVSASAALPEFCLAVAEVLS